MRPLQFALSQSWSQSTDPQDRLILTPEPVRQTLQSLGTIESQVEGVGKISERKVEEFAFEQPPARVRKSWIDEQLAKHAFIVIVFYRGFW